MVFNLNRSASFSFSRCFSLSSLLSSILSFDLDLLLRFFSFESPLAKSLHLISHSFYKPVRPWTITWSRTSMFLRFFSVFVVINWCFSRIWTGIDFDNSWLFDNLPIFFHIISLKYHFKYFSRPIILENYLFWIGNHVRQTEKIKKVNFCLKMIWLPISDFCVSVLYRNTWIFGFEFNKSIFLRKKESLKYILSESKTAWTRDYSCVG